MSNYVIGLTGGIACGKTNLTRALLRAGAPVIDADEISRALTAPGGSALPGIREIWGERVFQGEELNRRALSDIVFRDPAERDKLNQLLHPLIFAEIRRAIDAEEGPVALDVPLLFETGLDAWCDEIWCAYVPQKEQARRLVRREGVSQREAFRRIHAQIPTREKARKSNHVIRTDGTKEQSAQIVLSLWRDALHRAQQSKGESNS